MTQEVKESTTRATWSGKWAFILAAAASAVGLGNLWRFPYLAAKYGGGMFLLTYLVLVLTFGVSLLLLETALGRKTRLSVIGAYIWGTDNNDSLFDAVGTSSGDAGWIVVSTSITVIMIWILQRRLKRQKDSESLHLPNR